MLTVPGVSEGETACGVVFPPWFSLGFLWVSLQIFSYIGSETCWSLGCFDVV